MDIYIMCQGICSDAIIIERVNSIGNNMHNKCREIACLKGCYDEGMTCEIPYEGHLFVRLSVVQRISIMES